jgi:hypothetical protein
MFRYKENLNAIAVSSFDPDNWNTTTHFLISNFRNYFFGDQEIHEVKKYKQDKIKD